jgi:ABC-type Fe3+/spermidine/putrescine transport system ATPase subunit
MMNSGLSIIDVYKAFGEVRALKGVSLEVERGEIVAVLGPSGCGKSTLLGLVAGLEQPDAGEIRWEGKTLQGVQPHRRGFGLMFQDFALFPHMNVFDNIAFGLRAARYSGEMIRRRVAEMIELAGLAGFDRRDVNYLSGGEQQRVALARSLAPQPRLLMLDEPLGSLDRSLRERLLVDLRQILRGVRQTALYVTHDQEEAFTLADRVAVMNAGKMEQVGTPQIIYRQPASLFVARFLGLNNLLPGTVRRAAHGMSIETPLGPIPIPAGEPGQVTVLLRPDGASLDGRGEWTLEGRLVEHSFRGSTSRVEVEVGATRLAFEFPSTVSIPADGKTLRLSFDPAEAIQIFYT